MQTILAIDDESSVRESYRVIFPDEYRLLLAEDGAKGLEILESKNVDLILLDLTMPGLSGADFLAQLAGRGDATPVIVVTASNTVEAAVACMKHGAREFVIKPFDVEDLTRLVERTLDEVRSRRELSVLREQRVAGFENMVGSSPALLSVLARARQAMAVSSTVLITGETGTGKDILARAIHFGSDRREKPYVPLSCCAIPANLVESELFGHARGAFTGATENRVGKMQIADRGTLFLDEIGEMPLEAQSKLLRVLQDGCFYAVGGTKLIEVDVRFICATNRDFEKSIKDGIFREDLFYRINVLPLEMPALRKRREDIPELIAHFVDLHSARVGAKAREFTPRALSRLMMYDWPGNVRELENAVERILVCFREEPVIQAEFLDGIIDRPKVDSVERLADFEGLPIEEATNRLERFLISRALRRFNHVQSQAAEYLGTTRRILKYKMDQLGIPAEAGPKSMAG